MRSEFVERWRGLEYERDSLGERREMHRCSFGGVLIYAVCEIRKGGERRVGDDRVYKEREGSGVEKVLIRQTYIYLTRLENH